MATCHIYCVAELGVADNERIWMSFQSLTVVQNPPSDDFAERVLIAESLSFFELIEISQRGKSVPKLTLC